MIRLISAIDAKRGIAIAKGIPWDLSIDVKHFRDKTLGGNILMGFNTYQEFKSPLPERQNFVLTNSDDELRDGFIKVRDLKEFLTHFEQDIWVIGGAQLYAGALGYADELHLTRIDQDFRCTKFFPEFENNFRRISRGPEHHQNSTDFYFEVWERMKQPSDTPTKHVNISVG